MSKVKKKIIILNATLKIPDNPNLLIKKIFYATKPISAGEIKYLDWQIWGNEHWLELQIIGW